jgi:hypothetical protein
MRNQARLVGGTHEETPLVQDSSACWIVVDLFRYVLIDSVQEDVAKLVAASDCLVVDICDAREPSRLRVVGKDEQLTAWDRSVNTVECRLLHVADDDTGTDNIDRHDRRREGLASACDEV